MAEDDAIFYWDASGRFPTLLHQMGNVHFIDLNVLDPRCIVVIDVLKYSILVLLVL